MKVRKIEIEDIKQLSELFDAYRIFYKMEPDIIGSEKFVKERIENKESEIFVAENDKRELTGFVQLYPIFSSTRMKKLWLLNDLFVDQRSRGKGVSLLLIEEAKRLCERTNACGLTLETAKSNEIGNELYRKAKFALDTDHNYYWWENERLF